MAASTVQFKQIVPIQYSTTAGAHLNYLVGLDDKGLVWIATQSLEAQIRETRDPEWQRIPNPLF